MITNCDLKPLCHFDRREKSVFSAFVLPARRSLDEAGSLPVLSGVEGLKDRMLSLRDEGAAISSSVTAGYSFHKK